MLRTTAEITASDEAPTFGERQVDALAAAAVASIQAPDEEFAELSRQVGDTMARLWGMTGAKHRIDEDLITVVNLGRLQYLDAHEAERYAKARTRIAVALDMRP